MKLLKTPLLTLLVTTSLLLVSACVTDPGVSKKRGLVNDFSITKAIAGCGVGFLILSQPDTCVVSCTADTSTQTPNTPAATSGFHVATAAELTTAKNTTDTTLLAKINSSAGICIADAVVNTRPTNQIDIKSDFCSCINGVSDLISDCAAACASRPNTISPTLYLNTIIGPDIALNAKLGNLFNWCTVQLDTDTTTPLCFIDANDGTSSSRIPILDMAAGGNSLSANIQSLALDKTYIIKIVESKSGAQSKEIQIRRKTQTNVDTSLLGALKVTPINQYTCMTYGLTSSNTVGQFFRTTFARVFFYFAANETPPPVTPTGGNLPAQIVCHDEQLHPGNDSAVYPRLENIPQLFAMWDKADPRFVNPNNTGSVINKTLTTRLLNEYGIQANIDIFTLIQFPNRPKTENTSTAAISVPLGFMMVPFVDKSGKAFCPTQTDFNDNTQPLFNLLKEYMDDTEGLYLAEKEVELVQQGTLAAPTFTPVFGTMFVTETIVKTYGFYIENGLKIKATPSSLSTKTIYYYWPTNTTMDPLVQGDRRLFTVRTANTLNGNVPTGQPTQTTSDKRIGCVPKSIL